MPSRKPTITDSPSASSIILPQQDRRGSNHSVASVVDKETLNQVLNFIHNTASQSESLTAFNEFTTPPSSSSGTEPRGITSELQGGLSGLYSRLKASVNGVRDIVGGSPHNDDNGGTGDDRSSTKSAMPASYTSTPSAKPLFSSPNFANPSNSASKSDPDLASPVVSPKTRPGGDGGSSRSFGQLQNIATAQNSLASIVSTSKSGLSTTNNSRTSFMPLSQATTSTVVSPALNQININAVNEPGSHSQEHRNGENSVAAGPVRFGNLPNESVEKLDSKIKLAGAHKATLGETSEAPVEHEMKAQALKHASCNSDTSGGQGGVLKQLENSPAQSGFGDKTRQWSESTHLDISEQKAATQSNTPGTTNLVQKYQEQPNLGSKEPSMDKIFKASQAQDSSSLGLPRPTHSSRQSASSLADQQARTPEFSISRASSSETAEASSNNVTSDMRSSHGDMSDVDSNHTLDGIAIKPSPNVKASSETRNMVSIPQNRSRILSREYWMRDENARDCFSCGDPFSTFRRKHHCSISPSTRELTTQLICYVGTCGQIFDAKCTSLIPGRPFGQNGSLKVCKPCEGIINGNDDSSEFSDDGSVVGNTLRPRHGSTGANEASPVPSFANRRMSDIREVSGSPQRLPGDIPTMAILATRRVADDTNRRSAVLEFDAERRLVRPSSSRSLRSSIAARPYSSGHKRHHSRHQLQRSFKPVNEETAPFHRNADNDSNRGGRLPAFHSDNVIDPDLADFLSDDESSDDEQFSMLAALNDDSSPHKLDDERSRTSGYFNTKKSRSRMGDKNTGVSFTSRDPDSLSLSSGRLASSVRSKRRNLSVSSNMHLLRPSPRGYRFSTASPAVGSHLHESISSSTIEEAGSAGYRMMRSSSMKGIDAPAVELNNASIQHVRKLLRQLLQDSSILNINQWEKALMPILLQATDDVNPDVQRGDDIDIRHYVKLKKVPGGRPGDTCYVSGLVFTKNLALKSMPRSISHPNILILTFPLEYARQQQHFMSLEPVIRQEREFLQNLVHRIAALRPQLLLVERNISGLALEFLQQANIATAYNVKASVLEAVSRCAQTRIISSIDKLAIKPAQAGKCANFYLKTYVHCGRKKTYTFLSGCPKELGCTIVLRGGDNDVLAKIKRITEFMVYVVYNLKLETCLIRDEFALIPSYTEVGSLSPDKGRSKRGLVEGNGEKYILNGGILGVEKNFREEECRKTQASTDTSNAKVPINNRGLNQVSEGREKGIPEEMYMPDDAPMPTFYGDMVETHKTKILSASPFVKFMQPYILMRAREQERRLLYLKQLRDRDVQEEQKKEEELKPQKFVLIRPEMIHETVKDASKKVREVLHAVHDAEFDKALHSYRTQKKQWETYLAGNIHLFDPYAHQNIAVLYSVVCTVTTVPCSGPDLLALGFYNEHEIDEDFEADCTVGQYVEDLCIGANTVCTANGCERKMLEHHRQYVHGEAQLSVFVENYPCKLRGLQDTILMWSSCRICGNETQVLPMSESTWKYSFGKYLELSFWSSKLHPRAGVCPHDIHRNHLRYFGFKDMALRIQYDAIKLLEIIVPRTRITWKVVNDLRFKNEVFTKLEERINKFMLSVKARIKSIKVDSVIPEKASACKDEIEKLTKRAAEEHYALIRKIQDKYMDCKYYEIIPLNRAIRATQEKVAEWDVTFADFDRNFFPSEKDIRRLTTLQLRKIFLDRDDSVTSLASTHEGTTTPISQEDFDAKIIAEDVPVLSPQLTRTMSPEKAHDVLTSVVEEHSTTDTIDRHKSAPPTSIPILESSNPAPLQTVNHEDVQHLDLAVPSSFPERLPDSPTSLRPETPPVSPTTKGDECSDTPSSPSIMEVVKSESTDQPPIKEQPQASKAQASGIPRLPDLGFRRPARNLSTPLNRAQSQPGQVRRERTSNSGSSTPSISHSSSNASAKRPGDLSTADVSAKPTEKKLADRLGISALKSSGVNTHSMIPRSIASRRKESRVSTLAKHFEQLSREFEKERLKERRQRAAKSRQARAYPMASSKPIVEVYRNVHDAVEEKEPSDGDSLEPHSPKDGHQELTPIISGMAQNTITQTPGDGFHAEDTAADEVVAECTETDENTHVESAAGSDVENEARRSDEEQSIGNTQGLREKDEILLPSEAQLDLKLDLPKHEKSSLMKMLTNFWAERSASGWQPLEYPLNVTDHVFADSDIIVREDEPSSLIAFALGSEDYQAKLQSIQEKSGGLKGRSDNSHLQDPMLDTDEQVEVERSLLRSTGTHLKYQFQEGSAKMLCKIFYAEQFDAVRRKCGVAERIVESLSRCLKWDSKGGKTKSVFLKTLDDRFVLKSLSPIETQAFLKFAPAYFRVMSEALFHALPSVIAKMLGFYQIIIKNPATGVEFNWFLIIMENLFYDRSPTRIFDLKGSMRNRRIQSTGEQNEVLLDENMVEFIYESPLFAREHSKKLLRASVYNDTLFLSRQNVMDYSLMIAIDEDRKELVVGIIDCIRTYTWDKKLESWMKDRGKNRPTVTSPREYKSRFREAMGRYVLQSPE